MPSFLSYPGVYVEEIPSGVRTITGVPTSEHTAARARELGIPLTELAAPIDLAIDAGSILVKDGSGVPGEVARILVAGRKRQSQRKQDCCRSSHVDQKAMAGREPKMKCTA